MDRKLHQAISKSLNNLD